MAKGFEVQILDEIASGSKSPSPAFRSKDAAVHFAEGYSRLGSGHHVQVIQRRNGALIAAFRKGERL